MIKLDLLPPFELEKPKIAVIIIITVVFLVVEALVFFKAYTDLQLQAAWFDKDKDYYTARKADIDKEASAASDLKGKVNSWDSYKTFFGRKDTVEHSESIAKSLAEVGDLLRKVDADVWYDKFSVKGTDVTATGHINGLMNFVEFYFKAKAADLKIDPLATPTPSPDAKDVKETMEQKFLLTIKGTIKTTPTKAPAPPEAGADPKSLCVPGAAPPPAAATAAPAAAPAAGAAPGPAPAPAPAPAPKPAGGGGGGDSGGGGGGLKSHKDVDM